MAACHCVLFKNGAVLMFQMLKTLFLFTFSENLQEVCAILCADVSIMIPWVVIFTDKEVRKVNISHKTTV